MPEDFGSTAVAEVSTGADYTAETPTEITPYEGDSQESEVHNAEFVDDKSASEETAVVKAGERPVVGGKLTASGKAAIEGLKQTNPAFARAVTEALMYQEGMRQALPGGKKELAKLRQTLTKLGGDDGLTELQAIAEDMRQIDDMYDRADPAFLEKITETEQGKQNFVNLMGPTLAKFQTLAPEMFGHQMAKNFFGLMDQARFDITLSRIQDIAESTELPAGLIAAFNKIVDFRNAIVNAAATPPAKQTSAVDPKLQERETALAKKERELTQNEWSSAVGAERRRIFATTLAELTKGRTVSETQDLEIKGFYELALSQKLKQRESSIERFLANGDREGFLKTELAFFKTEIPNALRQAVQRVIPAKLGPRPVANPTRTIQTGPVKPPVAGFNRVKIPPSGDQIDWSAMSREQLKVSDGKFILKDGSRQML